MALERCTHARRSVTIAALLITASAVGCQKIPSDEPYDFNESAYGGTTINPDTSGGSDTGDPTSTSSSTGDSGEPNYQCDPGDDSTCSSGQKCAALLDDDGLQTQFTCVPSDASLTLYETCYLSANDGQDGCPPGSLCVARSVEQTVGACLPACTNANQCGSGACVSSPFSGLLHCAEPCDPLASACPGSMLCLSTTGQFGCQLPTEDDVGIAGDPCFGPDVRGCAEGYVCHYGELIPGCSSITSLCCTSVCDLEDVGGCDAPASCNPVFVNPPPGFDGIGACYTPT